MATIISIVSYPFLPAQTGGQKNVALFYKYFSKYHHLICISTKNNDIKIAEGYEVKNILSDSKSRYINFFYFFLIRKMIRQNKATHLLIEHPYYGWLAVLLKWFCNVRLIVHSHNLEGLRWKAIGKWWWKILWHYEKFTHRQADYNFFIQDDDKQYAIEEFGLMPAKCITTTYGIEWNAIPDKDERQRCRKMICEKYSIPAGDKILIFNGAFNYSPNLRGLKKIIGQINPILLGKKEFHYKIIICGKDVPAEITDHLNQNIIFAGFVNDVNFYLKAADVFLNPVSEGGGIKTKLVEALGNNLNAVSTEEGAVGIKSDLCNGKLFVGNKNDWRSFAELIVKASDYDADIFPAYFENFYWEFIAKKAASFIE